MSRHVFGMPMMFSMAPLYSVGHNDQMMCNMICLVMWCYQCQHWCQVMLMASSLAQFVQEAKTIETRCCMTFWVMWCFWHQCKHHMTMLILSMAPFCLLGQDDWNKVQHVIWVISLLPEIEFSGRQAFAMSWHGKSLSPTEFNFC